MIIQRLVQWAATFVFLIAGTIFLFKGFVSGGSKFIISSVVMLFLFIVFNKLASKKIRCEDGYTLIQAATFYKSCAKNGIETKSLSAGDLKKVAEIATGYDFSEKLTQQQLKTLYETGREVCKAIKK